MNFILKIVEGPNKGAEIALVEGVAVTLGKSEDCDIILADATLPDSPLVIEASADSVTIDGSIIDPFHVKSAGATSYAVGPADAAWGALIWPKVEEPAGEKPAEPAGEAPSPAPKKEADEKPAEEGRPEKKRGCGCLAALLALIILLLAIAAAGCFFFRDKVKEVKENHWPRIAERIKSVSLTSLTSKEVVPEAPRPTLADIAAKYGLSIEVEDGGDITVTGNLRTRRERLAATAELYETQPGALLDLSDDQSFRTAAEDALFTLTEGRLKVSAATNRVLAVTGATPSPARLKKVIDAISTDLPKLRDVDVSAVTFALGSWHEQEDANDDGYQEDEAGGAADVASTPVNAAPSLPICGILTTPYPCLVMKNGTRLLEGASIGGNVIKKIEADSVTLTNATGRFTWKP